MLSRKLHGDETKAYLENISVSVSVYLIYHEIQITIKQNSYTKTNESGEEAQKETMRLIDIGLPQSKNKVNINGKAWIESKIQ